ncbi:hypothetical protein [Amphibiibacter pelophylacis]|uniref:Uncharacterized protein n=1 Tax=Amphibiibacter pelophylacis TaxID=1799477 RepID=A0ACC6P6V6_9BURK
MKYSRTFSLYNFDHGFDKPATIRLNPFEIKISQTNINATTKLSRRATTNFTWSPQGKPIVSKTPAKVGRILKTATFRRIYSKPGDIDVPGNPLVSDEVGDLCLLLSFLTGRRVFQKAELSGLEGGYDGESVVGRNYFLTIGPNWPDVSLLHREGMFPVRHVSRVMGDS